MKITQLNIYPIKSLRPISLTTATLCPQGLTFDRRYIILRPASNGTYDSMFVGVQTEMALFHCKYLSPISFRVEYHPSTPPSLTVQSIEIPFEPVQSSLQKIGITMHTSSDYPAFKMPEDINSWFSDKFGYNVILAFMGDGLGTSLHNEKAQAWLPTIKPALPFQDAIINFSDTAAVLVTSEASLAALHPRLDGEKAVMEKFRPNIVIDGTKEWDEDFWGELTFPRIGAKIILTSNCARCMSVNVDLEKGRMGEGPSGSLLKRMMRDRRIDSGNKWSPIMGRYGFPAAGGELKVGDEVVINVRNDEHSIWNGIMPRLGGFEELSV